MRICFISSEYPPETGFGGIGTYTYNLAQGLSRQGHDITVITKALKQERVYQDKGVKVHRIFDKKIPFRGFTKISNFITGKGFSYYWHSRSVFLKIRELSGEHGKFDVIEGPLWDGECFGYGSRLGVPLVVRLQTPIFKSREILNLDSGRVLEYIEKKSLEKATLIAAISKDVRNLISSRYKIAGNKIKLSKLGVELPDIKKPVFRKKSFKLLYVGRLEKRKGTAEFIEAIPEILKTNSKISIDIVGKDIPQAPGNTTYMEYFGKIVPANLKKRVRFHGFIDKDSLNKFYRNCDVFVAPSRYESFGLIFLEAMAYGKPVIGTKIGGIVEIVKDKKTGILISVDNSKQIAKSVLKIFDNEKLREEMGENAFKHVRENLTVSQMVKMTLDVYAEAIRLFKI